MAAAAAVSAAAADYDDRHSTGRERGCMHTAERNDDDGVDAPRKWTNERDGDFMYHFIDDEDSDEAIGYNCFRGLDFLL